MILLVGEAPGRSGGPPLVGPRIASLAGDRMARTNLLDYWPGPQGKGSRFPIDEGRTKADELLESQLPATRFILMGARVAQAFGIRRRDFEWLEWFEHRGHLFAVCPHTSGIVLWWNDEGNREAAREFFRKARTYDRHSRYWASSKGRANKRRYNGSPKGRRDRARYNASAAGMLAHVRDNARRRGERC